VCLLGASALTVQAQVTYVPAVTKLDGGLSGPTGLSVDTGGNVYVANEQLGSVTGITAAGAVTTLATGFSLPTGIAGPDASGNIYVADTGSGAVRKITAAGTVTTLVDGLNAPRGLALDGSGNVYVGDGTAVKKITAAGVVTVLFIDFNGIFGLAVDASGNVYVADTGSSAVRKISPAGVVTTLATGLSGLRGVAPDPGGNLYVAANSGVLKVASDGVTTTVTSGFGMPWGLAVDTRGNIYVTDYSNGVVDEIQPATINFGQQAVLTSNAVIRLNFNVAAGQTIGSINYLTQGAKNLDFTALTSDTSTTLCNAQTYATATTCTVDVVFTPTVPGLRKGAVVLSDSNGNALATVYVSGVGTGPEAVLDPGTVTTYIGTSPNPTTGSNSCGGSASSIVSMPMGLAFDGVGNVFVSAANSSGTEVAQEFSAGNTTTPTVVGSSNQYGHAAGEVVDGAGRLIVVDNKNNGIMVYPLMGGAYGPTPVIYGGGNVQPPYPANTPATLAAFSGPIGVAVDDAGNIYVSDDTAHGYINEISAATGVITTIAGGGTNTSLTTPLVPTVAQLSGLLGSIDIDAQGNLWFADSGANVIREVNSSRTSMSVVAGNGIQGYSGDNGPATSATLNTPGGVSLDADGNAYITDSKNNAIREIVAASGNIVTLSGANSGAQGGYSAEGTTATAATYCNPAAVQLDGKGNLYVTDAGNNAIREINRSAPSYTFQSANLGSQSSDSPFYFTLNNIGNGTLVLANPAFSGAGAASYSLSTASSSACSPGSYPQGANCTYGINFNPAALSNPATMEVFSNTNAAGGQSITLAGAASTGIGFSPLHVMMAQSIIFTPPSPVAYSVSPITLSATDYDGWSVDDSGNPIIFSVLSGPGVVSGTTRTPTLFSANLATLTVTGVGTITIAANQAGGNYGGEVYHAAPQVTATIVVTQAAQTINFTAPVTPVYYGVPPITLSATGGASGNAVIFSVLSGPGVVNGSMLTVTGAGTIIVAANQAGNITYTAAAQVTATIVVVMPPVFTVTVTADDASGISGNCSDQSLAGANLDASCSLRDALAAAAQVSTSSITPLVNFAGALTSAATSTNPAVILLSSGLTIAKNMNIMGPGANLLSVSGPGINSSGNFTVFMDTASVTSSIMGLTITGGNGSTWGGGLSIDGIMTLYQSAITNNSAEFGGGILNFGTLTMNADTVSGNQATGNGGGIYNSNVLTISDSTVTGNTASAAGGGIYSQNSGLSLSNATVTGNTSSTVGGGVFVSVGTVSIANSIILGNAATNGSADVSGAYTGTGNILNTGSILTLAPLNYYGGTTQTMPPLPGSAAICAGTFASITGIPDQRGNPRSTSLYPTNPCVDAGAVQTAYSLAFVTQPSDTVASVVIHPDTSVQLSDYGSPFALPGATVTMTAAAGTLSGTTNPVTGSTGLATFNGLAINTGEETDTLTASIAVGGGSVSVTSNTFNVIPPQGSQIIIFTQMHPLTYGVLPITLSATATSGLPVTLSVTSGPGTLNGNVLTVTGTGTIVVAANQAGNGSYLAAPQVTQTIVVNQATQTITFTLPVSSVTYGVPPITLSATGGGSGNAVVFSLISGPGTLSGSVLTVTNIGNIVIAASQAGNSNYAAAQVTATLVVVTPPLFLVTVTTDAASSVYQHCTDQWKAGATPDTNCSLRDALAAAWMAEWIGTSSVMPIVSFASALTSTATSGNPTIILLSSGLNITSNVAIYGPGANMLTISGGGSNSGFTVIMDWTAITSTINDLTISGGGATWGGGIFVMGNMTLNGCVISNSTASTNGGGISNQGTLTINGSTVSGNSSTSFGGSGSGIYNEGTLTMTGSTVTGNTASSSSSYGGGIYNTGTLTLNDSTVTGNSANIAGGIYQGGPTVLTLNNTTVTGNIAGSDGGGIYILYGTAISDNSIIIGNSAGSSYADLRVANGTTFTDNGGNIYNAGTSTTSPSTGNLAPLANYGGSTQTMPPLPGSAAICAGTYANIGGVTTDQRGNPRFTTLYPTRPCVDAGAVQTAYSLAFVTQPTDTAVGTAISAAPSVQLSDYGSAIALPGTTVTVAAAAGTLSGTTNLVTGSTGLATFNGLSIGTGETADTLTASITVGGGSVYATSNNFNVTGGVPLIPVITWLPSSNTGYLNTAVSAIVLNAATTTTTGTFAYTATNSSNTTVAITSTSMLPLGTYTLTATFTPTDTNLYATATATVTYTVVKQSVFVVNAGGSITSLYEGGGSQSSAVSGGGTGAAVDANGLIWSVTPSGTSVTVFTDTGAVSTTHSTGASSPAMALAIDGNNTTWLALSNGTVTALTNSGTGALTLPIDPAGGAAAAGSISVDTAGSLWISNPASNTVTEVIGSAAPIAAPVVNQVINSTTGMKP
jgi:sugar lactone lactonase YvrE